MKALQQALASLMPDVPVMAGVWRATSEKQNPAEQYVVYSTTTTEAAAADDGITYFRTYVYLNLWSDIDPTETADRIRTLMYAAGFGMLEQSDKGYNQPAYDTATRQYTMQWTFVLFTEEYPS